MLSTGLRNRLPVTHQPLLEGGIYHDEIHLAMGFVRGSVYAGEGYFQSDEQSQFNTPSEHVGNADLTQLKNRQGQSAYDRWLELSGYGLPEAFNQRMQSPAYVNASDGNSWYTASSRANMLREIQHRFQDKAMTQFAGSFL